MESLSKLNIFEVRALVKLVACQATLNPSLDGVYLPDLADRLRKALTERSSGVGVMDMHQGNFDFKIRWEAQYRVNIIKMIREVMNLGLKEAKDVSDLGYEPVLPHGEVTFLNATEELYTRFVTVHGKLFLPGWNSIRDTAELKAAIQIMAISQPTASPVPPEVAPAGSD